MSSTRFYAALVLLSLSTHSMASTSADVTWLSPAGGDVYGPGDKLAARWSSAQALDSPSFRLCMSPEGPNARRKRDLPGSSRVRFDHHGRLHVPHRPEWFRVQRRHGGGDDDDEDGEEKESKKTSGHESESEKSEDKERKGDAAKSKSSEKGGNGDDEEEEKASGKKATDGGDERESKASSIDQDARPSTADESSVSDSDAKDSESKSSPPSPTPASTKPTPADEDVGACGAPISATVQQSDGSYLVSLALPAVSSTTGFYLEMRDASGIKTTTPSFSLSPSSVAAATEDPESQASTPASSPAATPNSQIEAALDRARRAPPTAAYAVPLALVGTIVVVAAVLAYRQKQKLTADRKQELSALEKGSLPGSPASNIGSPYMHMPRRTSRRSLPSRDSTPRSVTREPFPCAEYSPEELDAYRSTDSMRVSRACARTPASTFRQHGQRAPFPPPGLASFAGHARSPSTRSRPASSMSVPFGMETRSRPRSAMSVPYGMNTYSRPASAQSFRSEGWAHQRPPSSVSFHSNLHQPSRPFDHEQFSDPRLPASQSYRPSPYHEPGTHAPSWSRAPSVRVLTPGVPRPDRLHVRREASWIGAEQGLGQDQERLYDAVQKALDSRTVYDPRYR